MDTLNLQTVEAKLKDFADANAHLRVLGLFGSYAKQKARPDSDLDICMASDRPISMAEKIDLTTQLSILLKKEIDLLDLNASHGVILEEALHSAIWIKKDPIVFSQIVKRMLLDKVDFQPYYNRMLEKKRERFLKK